MQLDLFVPCHFFHRPVFLNFIKCSVAPSAEPWRWGHEWEMAGFQDPFMMLMKGGTIFFLRGLAGVRPNRTFPA